MSSAKLYTFTPEELTGFANQVKDLLQEDLDIPELGDVAIVVAQKGMFGQVLDKCFSGKEDATKMFIITPVSKKVKDETSK